jgi:hypothetical protein
MNVPRATVVKRQEVLSNKWMHVCEPGVPWQAALEQSYWSLQMGKLAAGDTIEIHSSDRAIRLLMHIIDTNQAIDYLVVGFAPIWPLDLQLPEGLPLVRPPRFAVRQARGSSLFNVVDLSTGEMVDDHLRDRSTAMELSATLERASLTTEAQIARQLDQAEDAPAKSKAALRAERYRERKRAEAHKEEVAA